MTLRSYVWQSNFWNIPIQISESSIFWSQVVILINSFDADEFELWHDGNLAQHKIPLDVNLKINHWSQNYWFLYFSQFWLFSTLHLLHFSVRIKLNYDDESLQHPQTSWRLWATILLSCIFEANKTDIAQLKTKTFVTFET